MVRIRLRRVGSKNQPSFRIVVADKEAPRDGRFLEIIGHYNPRTEPSTVVVDEARLFHWMKNGAQPSDAVVRACRALGTWERWERFKKGEPLETLLEEAKAAMPEVDPRTRRDDLIGKRKKKARAREQAKEVEAAAAEPAGEAEAAAEEAAPEAMEAEAPEEEPAAESEAPEAEPEERAGPEAAAEQAEAPAEPEADTSEEAPEQDSEAEPAE